MSTLDELLGQLSDPITAQDLGGGSESPVPKFNRDAVQATVQRYRPRLDGNFNNNEVVLEQMKPRQSSIELLEATMGHADAAVGLQRSTLGARVTVPHRNNQTPNVQALGNAGMGGSLNFGKPKKVSSKDLYKLQSNAANAITIMRQMGFNGTVHGFGSRSNKSDHPHGNALDFMVGGNAPLGNKIAGYFISNRKQLGVKYVIWKQRIASASSGWKWRKMEDRGSSTANHMDHPHVSFY